MGLNPSGIDLVRTEKQCRTCKEVKPIDEFWFQSRKTGLRQYECKPCMRMRTTKWARSNREKFRAMNLESTHKKRVRNPVNGLIQQARHRAKKRGLEFSITAADVVVPDYCPVLGIKLEWHTDRGRTPSLDEKDTSPSIDRIDNNRGYVPDNIVVVSYRANRFKSNASIEEMRKMVEFYGGLDGTRSGA